MTAGRARNKILPSFMNESDRPALSVVVPLFDEEPNVEPLCRRLLGALEELDASFEVILVDDGSRDRTLELLYEVEEAHPEVRVLSLARNFGQHAAVIAGLAESHGDFVVTLDADLQNPPEEIARLLAEFRKGHDMVATVRSDRNDSWFRRSASAIVNRVTRRISGIELHDFGCMLRGYSREIADRIAERYEIGAFIPALGYLYSSHPVEIAVAHEARNEGHSKYSLVRLFRLHLDLVTGFSLAPLRLLFGAGAIIAGAGILFGALLLILRLVQGSKWSGEGTFTLFAILFFFVGAQFIAFGLLGEYVGRIFQSVRQRPAYVLREPARSEALRQAELPRSRPARSPESARATIEA